MNTKLIQPSPTKIKRGFSLWRNKFHFALVMLGITGAAYAKILTLNNNSNENIHVGLPWRTATEGGGFDFTLKPQEHVVTQEITVPLREIKVFAIKPDLKSINTNIKLYSVEIPKNSSKTTYNISIVDNKIVVS